MSRMRNRASSREPEVEERIVVARLVEPRDGGGARAQLDRRVGRGGEAGEEARPSRRARSSSSSAGTTASIRPMARAPLRRPRSRPVEASRSMCRAPTRGGTAPSDRSAPRRPGSPRRARTCCVPFAATRSSAAIAKMRPPAIAWPESAATTGGPKTKSWRTSVAVGRRRTASISARLRSTRNGRSQPAEKIPGVADARTTARAFARCDASADESAATSSGSNALALGRLSVRIAISSRTST